MSGRIGIPVLPWENLSSPYQDAIFCTSREEARSQVVTRPIDLFVDIAVLLRKLVYRFSGTYSSSPPDSCRVEHYLFYVGYLFV